MLPLLPRDENAPYMEADDGCKLLNVFAVLMQVLMAFTTLLSLLYKRYQETPQRDWLVWIMDTSKQAISATLVHFVNILVSYISVFLPQTSTNPCVWYFLNVFLDTTLGVYALYMFLLRIHKLAMKFGIDEITMGYYGDPPRLYPWCKQLMLFLLAWFGVKVTVVILLTFVPHFGRVAEWIFLIFKGNTKGQVVFAMLIFPLCMNIVQGTFTLIQRY